MAQGTAGRFIFAKGSTSKSVTSLLGNPFDIEVGMPPDGRQSAMEALMGMVLVLQQQVASLLAVQAAAAGGSVPWGGGVE